MLIAPFTLQVMCIQCASESNQTMRIVESHVSHYLKILFCLVVCTWLVVESALMRIQTTSGDGLLKLV